MPDAVPGGMEHDSADRPVRAPLEPLAEYGGDQACWLSQVCPECGRLTEGRAPSHCAGCGKPLSD